MQEERKVEIKKYPAGNDNKSTVVKILNRFVSETYGNFMAIDSNSIEVMDKLHSYIDLFYPQILNDKIIIKKYEHIFFISADQEDGIVTVNGPERSNAIKIFQEIKSAEVRSGESPAFGILAEQLSKIPEIQISLTPVMEILTELINRNSVTLISTRSNDAKRLKYFNEIKDLKIFSSEYKYDACIITPGEEFNSVAINGISSLLSYIMVRKIPYILSIPSIKPYIRTAYSYYYLCMLSGLLLETGVELLRKEYGILYGREPDIFKFKKYLESIANVNILNYKDNMVTGIEEIFKKLL